MSTLKELALLAVLATVMLLVMGAVLSAEQMWHSTPSAPHHNACVEVLVQNRGGAGTVFAVGPEYCYVLTAGHVAEQSGDPCEITWNNGATAQGTVLNSQSGTDLALLQVRHGVKADWELLQYIPVAVTYPAQGSMCEVTGYGTDGNGGDDLRHFYARVQGYQKTDKAMTLETSVCSGDSGGGVIVDGELVSVIRGGSVRTDESGGNRGRGGYVWPAIGANTTQIREFLTASRWSRYCGPSGCKPDQPWGGQITPPAQVPQGSGAKPPITIPPAQKEPVVDPCEDLKASITALEAGYEMLGGQISGVSFALDSRAGQAESSAIEIFDKFDLFDGKLLGIEEKTEGRFSLLSDAGQKSYQANEEQNSTISALVSGQNSIGTYVGLATLLGATGPVGFALGAAGWLAARRLKKRIGAKDQGPNGSDRSMIHDLRTTLAQNKVNHQREIDNTDSDRELSHRKDENYSLKHTIDDRDQQIMKLTRDAEQLKDRPTTDCEGELLRRKQEVGALADLLSHRDAHIERLTRQVEKTENHYVHVPVTDGEAEAYKEACRKVVRQYPNYEQVVKLVEGIADQIHHGQKVAQE